MEVTPAAVPNCRAMFVEICCGQKDAEDFCHAFHTWVHFMDDVVDGEVDGEKGERWPVSTVVEIGIRTAWTFATNPFFQNHRLELMALITQAVLAWEDSEEWSKRADPNDRVAAAALKGTYHLVFWHIAFWCGGTAHVRAITKKYRQFSYDLPSAE